MGGSLEPHRPGLEFRLNQLLIGSLCANYFSSLRLSFLISKIAIIPTLGDGCGN